MILNLERFTFFIYLSFAFDSLLKLNFGVQLHLGIIAILLVNAVIFLERPKDFFEPFKVDKLFTVVVSYFLINGALLNAEGYGSISVYLFITVNIFIFCFYTVSFLKKSSFYYFQIILIITGLIQYFCFKLFNVQISFIDPEHYNKGYSVAERLRGFFVEPNWFSIALAFNTLLLVGSDVEGFAKRYPWLLGLTLFTFVVNGTLTTVGIILIAYSYPYVKKAPLKGIILSLLLFILVAGVYSFRSTINPNKSNATALNHSSRVLPLLRVISYQSTESTKSILFGHGLGSWGTEAIENRLSVLVYEEKKDARDGSELPVFIFELGVIGTLLVMLDLFIMYMRANKQDLHLRGGILLFFVCLLLYPTLKFWMYMPYYFYMRAMIYGNKNNLLIIERFKLLRKI